MSYSFVRLYLSKCNACVLNHIWINPKRFLIILYIFGSGFYYSLCSCLVLTLFFIYLNMFCFEKQVSEFLATHFDYLHELPVLATRFGDLQLASRKSKPSQIQATSSHRRVSQLTCDSLVAKRPESAF